MSHYWNVNYFPFDKQKISIPIYNVVFSSDELVFKWDKVNIHVPEDSELEGGWKLDTTVNSNFPIHKSTTAIIDDQSHSVFRINFELRRVGKGLLFLNLFIGMYIAFFVSYIAFFIGLKHDEPRFGLPVGGLFAAIANKYVVQDLLPKSPGFTLVDFLHIFTVVMILLIILSSAIRLSERDKLKGESLDLHESEMSGWVKKYTLLLVTPKIIFYSYISVNVFMVLFGIFLEAFGLS